MSENNQTLLSIKNLCISSGELALINSFNLELNSGDCKSICAPTGTGKTSIFNYIADILPVQGFSNSGLITKIDGLKICYAFQEPRLVRSVSVEKNVMLPLENLTDKNNAQKLAQLWLEKLNLSHKMTCFPNQLSGGEQQRAGLARAFAWGQICFELNMPRIFLLDEPFASQDSQNIKNIVGIIREQTSLGNTASLIISHDKQTLESFCTQTVPLM